MSPILYATACVLLPAAWGVAMHYVFAAVIRRRGGRASDAAAPERTPIDYEI